MHAYDKSYLEDAMLNLAVALDYGAQVCSGGITEFYNRLLAGEVIHNFETGNPRYLVGMSGVELAGRIIENTGGVHIATDYTLGARTEAFWAGWSLAYLQWCTGMAFELLSRNGIDIQCVLKMYPALHEADLSKFVAESLKIMSNGRAKEPSLRRQRRLAGFTQQELSARSGVSLRMIRAYEQNAQDISKAEASAVLNLAYALNCSPYLLLEPEVRLDGDIVGAQFPD